ERLRQRPTGNHYEDDQIRGQRRHLPPTNSSINPLNFNKS
ncbi:hypothetical protein CCACVL1_13891, partial [Corchorus capsularis]